MNNMDLSSHLKVGIIGGNGGMGSLFAKLFKNHGFSVEVSGRNTKISNKDLARNCDIVMISVPIRVTTDVIEEIAPLLRKDQIICDLTSLKVKPIECMLKSKAEVIGFHPMFGPSVSSIFGQTIIVVPTRCSDGLYTDFVQLFEKEGAICKVTDAKTHDKLMAVIQGLTHFKAFVLASTMRRLEISPEDTEAFMSPVYKIETSVAGRLLAQSPKLYADILINNPEVSNVLDICTKTGKELSSIIENQDKAGFEAEFLKNREWYGNYCERSLEETDFLIDKMASKKDRR